MSSKASSTKTKAKTTAKAAPRKPAKAAKASWAETMKKALEKKQPAGGFPNQGKPRDSTVQKVKKNSF